MEQISNMPLSKFGYVRFCLGMCLVFCGVPTSMLLNYLYPIVHWTPLIMALSALFLVSFNGNRKKLVLPKHLKILILFQLMMLLYWFVSCPEESSGKYLQFHVYILALIFIITHNSYICELKYIPVLFLYSSILSLTFAFFHYSGLYELLRIESGYDKSVIEVFTMNVAAFTNLLCCILMSTEAQKRLYLLVLVLMLCIDIYVIVESGKRSYFISSLVAVGFYFYKKVNLKKFSFIIVTSLFAISLVSEDMRDNIEQIFEKTGSGLVTVFGEKKEAFDENDSGSLRRYMRDDAMKKVNDNFSLVNYVVGGGYLFAFLDNPVLESYIDMGVLGFVLFGYLVILLPLKLVSKVSQYKKEYAFPVLYSLMAIVISVTNNDPYIYITYSPLCFVFLFEPYMKLAKTN